jgi:hypothetical protein
VFLEYDFIKKAQGRQDIHGIFMGGETTPFKRQGVKKGRNCFIISLCGREENS